MVFISFQHCAAVYKIPIVSVQDPYREFYVVQHIVMLYISNKFPLIHIAAVVIGLELKWKFSF